MTKNGKCGLIIDTLLQMRKGLSLRQLNDRWERSSLYDGKPLHERTFARYKEFIADEYNIDIEYDSSANKYSIENADDISSNALYRYLLSAYRVAGLNTQVLHHRDCLMLEPVPTGTEHLETLLRAIDEGRTVLFNYGSYYSDRLQDWELIPCFLRIFEGRWYLVAEYLGREKVKTYALERITNLRLGEKQLRPSAEITSDRYYAACYGIVRDEREAVFIRLRADREQRYYLRAQPLHGSQKEVESGEDYSVFEYYLRPSFDLFQKILWMREKVEILAPESVRAEFAGLVGEIAAKYRAKEETA